jgi:uncharacterized protein (TIGR00251 family)
MSHNAILNITVAPKSSRNRISILQGTNIKAYLTAPPVDGEANAALIGLLSKTLKIPKSKIEIIHGAKSKKKLLRISEITYEEVVSKIEKS